MTTRALPLQVLAALPDGHDAPERAAFAQLVRDRLDDRARASLLVTCHRVEWYATGADGAGRAVDLESAAVAAGLRGLRRLEGREAVTHLLRLAAGLESAVTGEDEVLHQVRGLLDAVRAMPSPDPGLVRALELAIGVGRRARADRPRPQERSMADRALDWVAPRGDGWAGMRILVVGAGVMGRAIAAGAARRGATVTVTSRDPGRAHAVAQAVGGAWGSLDDAAARASEADAVLVALSGSWDALAARWEQTAGRAPSVGAFPPIADVSSPPAVPEPVRRALGDRFVGVDQLFGRRHTAVDEAEEVRRSYVEHAERLVQEACDQYVRWAAARPSVATLAALRATAERQRARELERLLRRLPGLDDRERALVAGFSEQLVARILHQPSARLHDDADGTAAAAARLLFDL